MSISLLFPVLIDTAGTLGSSRDLRYCDVLCIHMDFLKAKHAVATRSHTIAYHRESPSASGK